MGVLNFSKHFFMIFLLLVNWKQWIGHDHR